MKNNTSQNIKYHWSYIFSQIIRHRRPLMIANLFAILATMASVPLPLLIPLLVDEVILNQPKHLTDIALAIFPAEWVTAIFLVLFFTALSIFLRLLWLALSVLQARQFTLISKEVIYQLRKDLLGKLRKTSIKEYETLGSGAVSARFVVDMETIDNFIGISISRFIIGILTLLGVTLVLLWIHWQLALFILLFNPLVIYFTVLMGKKIKDMKKDENQAFECFQQTLTETLDAIQQIRSSNRDRYFFNKLSDHAYNIKKYAGQFTWKSDAVTRSSFLIFLVGFDIFRALGTVLVLVSHLSLGEMLAIFSYLWFMLNPVQDVLGIHVAWFGAKAALNRVNQLELLKEEPVYPHTNNPFRQQQTVSIRAENIQFSYNDKQSILNNISLSIAAGSKIALVGASGGGKSTFIQVLLGLYQPQQGCFYFNDIPSTQIGFDIIRENVATVLQRPALFNATIRNNLTLGETVSDASCWQALEIAQLKTTIEQLEQGLDTQVGKDGMRLSGGQRQRLAVARMVLSNPKVVILDEATSALDTETEEKLHQAMSRFLHNKTTLIIAHRLSAVRQADHIFVFENGHIIEQGQHQQLVKNKGLYQRLYGEMEQG